MITIIDSVVVAQPVDHVFGAIIGMAASTWQTDAIHSEATTDGPIGSGTRFKEKFHVLGEALEAECVVTAFELGRVVAWTGTARDLSYEGRFEFAPEAGGCRLTYAGTTVLGGPWQARAGEIEQEWRAKNHEELQQIKAMLEGQAMEA